jgi:hypothetical protein
MSYSIETNVLLKEHHLLAWIRMKLTDVISIVHETTFHWETTLNYGEFTKISWLILLKRLGEIWTFIIFSSANPAWSKKTNIRAVLYSPSTLILSHFRRGEKSFISDHPLYDNLFGYYCIFFISLVKLKDFGK